MNFVLCSLISFLMEWSSSSNNTQHQGYSLLHFLSLWQLFLEYDAAMMIHDVAGIWDKTEILVNRMKFCFANH